MAALAWGKEVAGKRAWVGGGRFISEEPEEEVRDFEVLRGWKGGMYSSWISRDEADVRRCSASVPTA